MADLEALMQRTTRLGASDLHLQPGIRPRIRVGGDLIEPQPCEPVEGAALHQAIEGLLDPPQRERLRRQGYLDFSHLDPEGVAWRCHVYQQRRGLAAALRPLAAAIPTLAQLGLPHELERLAHLRSGLVLITGATGSGKSTTLAALVGVINRVYRKTIITLEDPIEYLFRSERSVIQQRAVGTHVVSFGQGVRDAIDERPDVLVVGELRDYETVRAALSAAETGALVFATLHSNDATQTLDRILDLFPHDEQPLARVMLAQSLQGLVSQALLQEAEGKRRLPACEVLFRTPALAQLIRAGKVHEVRNCIQTGRSEGMRLLDDSLAELLEGGKVSREEVLRFARTKERFRGPFQTEEGAVPFLAALGARKRSPKDRRHEPRVHTLNLVNVGERDATTGLPAALTLGRTLDLSHDGVRVEVDHPLLLRSRVTLGLALEDRIVEVEGSVCTVQELDDHTCAVGVRFARVSADAQAQIDAFLRAHG